MKFLEWILRQMDQLVNGWRTCEAHLIVLDVDANEIPLWPDIAHSALDEHSDRVSALMKACYPGLEYKIMDLKFEINRTKTLFRFTDDDGLCIREFRFGLGLGPHYLLKKKRSSFEVLLFPNLR